MEETKKIDAKSLLDMPQVEFEKFVTGVSLGDASNLSFFLKATYEQVRLAKNGVLEKMKSDTSTDLKKHLDNLFLLLFDIENKTIFVESYKKRLISGDNTVNNT